jgi:TolA-binding protein
MKRGDHAAAAASFKASRTAAGSAVVEDATFWEGVALARAGDSTAAIAALRRFTASYPKSPRIGEASARLGWLLLDAGDDAGAAAMFHAAEHDRVERVRASAKKGLAKLR